MHKVCKQMHFILVAHKQRTALYILFLTHACSHAHALQLWETSSTIFLKHCISLSLCHPTVNMIAPFYRFSCHFSFAPGFCLWTLVLHVTTIACKCVGACVCICLIFTSVSVCDFVLLFFLKARYPSANSARQKIKAGQMRIPATWAPILPSGSDDSWAFLSPVDLFCCLLFQFLLHPTPHSFHDLNPFFHPSSL